MNNDHNAIVLHCINSNEQQIEYLIDSLTELATRTDLCINLYINGKLINEGTLQNITAHFTGIQYIKSVPNENAPNLPNDIVIYFNTFN